MADFGNEAGMWLAKLVGSAAGAAVSLAYLLPKNRREAATRFFTGLSCGLIFGGPAGLWLTARLGVSAHLSGPDILLTGSAAASLTAWWGLGVLSRLAEHYGGRSGGG